MQKKEIDQKVVEKQSLIVSSIVNFIMAVAGIWVFVVTKMQALFLDGVFSGIAFLSILMAAVISTKSKKRTKTYPDGLYFLEPVYGIFKSVLTLALLAISVTTTSVAAYEYFALGIGEVMNTGPILPYSICMVVLCFGLGTFNKLQNRKIKNLSTILGAESKSNFVDGIISAGVGICILLVQVLDVNGPLGFLHYTGDFFVTVILCLISLKAPITVFISAFKELSGGVVKDKEIQKTVNDTVSEHIGEICEYERCDVIKVGMHIKVRIILASNASKITQDTFQKLQEQREKIADMLKSIFNSVETNYIF